jgi:hypothetical protein
MVEWTRGTILTCIAGALIIIGSLTGWWAIKHPGLIIEFTDTFNPIIGINYWYIFYPSSWFFKLAGLAALVGGVLLFVSIKKPALRIYGGILPILGLVLFVIFWYVVPPSWMVLELGKNMGLFEIYLSYTTYLTYGFYVVLAGAIIGIICSIKIKS